MIIIAKILNMKRIKFPFQDIDGIDLPYTFNYYLISTFTPNYL